jgi:hypothetical protein
VFLASSSRAIEKLNPDLDVKADATDAEAL